MLRSRWGVWLQALWLGLGQSGGSEVWEPSCCRIPQALGMQKRGRQAALCSFTSRDGSQQVLQLGVSAGLEVFGCFLLF